MRKAITILGIFISTSLLVYLVYGIISKIDVRMSKDEEIMTLPSFSFPDLSGRIIHSDSISEGPVLIVKFHPECEHCQYEINEILNSPITKTGTKIYLITNAGKEKTVEYISGYKVNEVHNLNILLDTAGIFGEIFGRDMVPSNFIYNRDLELITALYGEYKVESIMKYLGINE